MVVSLKSLSIGIAAAALGLSLLAAQVSAEPSVGEPAPEFTGTDSEGKARKLSEYRGKTVVLEWTNHGCPYVGKHYDTGNMQALQKDAAEKGVVWLSVVSSAPGKQGHVSGEEANELTESRKASPAAVILDPEGTIGRAYGATATPHMYVIDKDGKLVYKGAIDDRPTSDHDDVKGAKNYVRMALGAAEAGKPADPAATRAYGCSVKYTH